MVRYGGVEELEEGVREAIFEALQEDEEFLGAIRAADAIRTGRRTRLVLTDRRLLTAQPTRSGIRLQSLDRDAIRTTEYDSGVLQCTLTVTNRQGSKESWKLDSDGADAFARALQSDDRYSVFVGPENQPVLPQQPIGTLEANSQQNTSGSTRRQSSVTGSSLETAHSQRSHLEEVSMSTLASRLQGMDDYEFEHFIADLWDRMGWQTSVSQASVDAGIDVIALQETPYPQKKVIQAKRYGENSAVGGPDVQQYASLKHQIEDADSVVIVTTGTYTRAGRERADELNVKLVDGDSLAEMIDDLDAYDLVADYLDTWNGANQRGAEGDSVPTASYVEQGQQPDPNERTGGSEEPDPREQGEPVSSDGGAQVTSVSDNTQGTNGLSGETPLEARNWHYGIIAGTALAFLAVPANVGSLGGLMMILLPILTYVDAREIRSASVGWEPRIWLHTIGAVFFFIGPPIYLYRRWRMVGI